MLQYHLRIHRLLPMARTKTEAIEIGDHQAVIVLQQRDQAPEFEMTAVKAVKHQHRWPGSKANHGVVVLNGSSQFKPIHRCGKRAGLLIEQ